MLLYYGVLIKISNLHTNQNIKSACSSRRTKHRQIFDKAWSSRQQSKYPARKHILKNLSSKKTYLARKHSNNFANCFKGKCQNRARANSAAPYHQIYAILGSRVPENSSRWCDPINHLHMPMR